MAHIMRGTHPGILAIHTASDWGMSLLGILANKKQLLVYDFATDAFYTKALWSGVENWAGYGTELMPYRDKGSCFRCIYMWSRLEQRIPLSMMGME